MPQEHAVGYKDRELWCLSLWPPSCVSTHSDAMVSAPSAVPPVQQQSLVQEAEEEGERVVESYFFFRASCCNTPQQGTSLAVLPALPLAPELGSFPGAEEDREGGGGSALDKHLA